MFKEPGRAPSIKRRATHSHTRTRTAVPEVWLIIFFPAIALWSSAALAAALLVAASWDPYALMEEAVTAAAALSGGGRPRTMKELPASLDAFGWCTWDAFYSRVSARGTGPRLARGDACASPAAAFLQRSASQARGAAG